MNSPARGVPGEDLSQIELVDYAFEDRPALVEGGGTCVVAMSP